MRHFFHVLSAFKCKIGVLIVEQVPVIYFCEILVALCCAATLQLSVLPQECATDIASYLYTITMETVFLALQILLPHSFHGNGYDTFLITLKNMYIYYITVLLELNYSASVSTLVHILATLPV